MKRFATSMLALLLPSVAAAQSSPSAFTYATRYDAGGRVVGTIAPDPDGSGSLRYPAVRNTYDAAGRLIRVERGELSNWQSENVAPASWGSNFSGQDRVDTTYDAMDRKVVERRIGSDGVTYAVTQYSYNNQRLLECTAVRMNTAAFGNLPASACSLGTEGSQGPDRITRNVYDAAGQLLKVQKAYGTSLQEDYATYTYSANGKRTSVTDATGNKASMTYDGLDRQAAWNFPSPTSVGTVSTSDYEAYGYDANGNRTSLRKRDGRGIAYVYDALNRITSKTYPNGGARGVYYAYDLQGHQTAARYDSASGDDAVLSGWNGFGEQISSTTAMGGISRTLGYHYNADGARSRLTFPDAQWVDILRYDTDQLYYTTLSGSPPLFYTPLDNFGRIAALYRWVNGGWNTPTVYGYDGISRLSGQSHAFTNTGFNVQSVFDYNPASQVTSSSRSNDGYAFTGYVNVDRSYASNGLNQYTSAGPATFGYDANGNLVSDGTTNYGYDIENRLVSASNGTQLTYDPTGRLWQTLRTNYGTTQFLYDGDALVAEYDGAGNMLRRYVHGDSDDDPLVQYVGAGVSSPYYLYADHQGSIVAIADASGNVTSINRYDEYGIPGASNTGRFQYTGQAWIPELGMYHYKARIYSPTLGRFLQTDPIGYDDQINLYAYVANDPVNKTDPTGEDGDDIVVTGRRLYNPFFVFIPGTTENRQWAERQIELNRRISDNARNFISELFHEKADPNAPADARDPNGAKAPGKPGKEEGFTDPQDGERWKPGGNGERGGWVDADGSVWRPTGQAPGRAHGGPHWDVTDKNGNSQGNRYPGGHTRPHGN